jgi:hypothetical protein
MSAKPAKLFQQRAAERLISWRLMIMFAFDRQPRFNPIRLALGVISNIRVSQRRQFTGSVLRSMSSRTGAVDYNLSILVRQERGCQSRQLIRR